ncbi:MAG: hypothetical protein JST62_04505 [Bacteroidetes bacterium]|jgi:hypothetical protein|nr:hypothetical protein [Bacteroidota bacterium]
MKKIAILFTFLISTVAFSQIKIIKTDDLIEVGKDNSVGLYKRGNKYVFNYQDVNAGNLNTIRSFTFSDINGDMDTFYNLILDGLKTLPKEDITLELPEDILELHFEKNFAQPTVQFIHYINKSKKYIGKSQVLNKKQIDKIFGKTGGSSAFTSTNNTATTPAATSTNASTKQQPINTTNVDKTTNNYNYFNKKKSTKPTKSVKK